MGNFAAVTYCTAHTHTLSHTTVVMSLSVFPAPSNQHRPAVPPSGRSRGEVSQSVFLLVFEYCILLFLFKLPLV